MTEQVMARPPLDDPWGRLIWIVPAALALWIVLIAAFSMVLGEREAPPPAAIDAQLIELPPPPPPPIAVGLKGGGAAKPAAPIMHKPAPIHHQHPAPRRIVPHVNAPKVALPPETAAPPPSAGGEANPAGASEGAGGGGAANGGVGGEGSGGGEGAGSDSGGARAIFAPKPIIPDDLRENAMNVVAVARFTVTADGVVKVALLKSTPNPRLNEILLDTLAKWQFFPAVRNGEPVDSTIDIQIPITVQ